MSGADSARHAGDKICETLRRFGVRYPLSIRWDIIPAVRLPFDDNVQRSTQFYCFTSSKDGCA
jgi:hypothetical protein